MMKNLRKCDEEWVLTHRPKMLVLTGLCGLVLVFVLHLSSEFVLALFCADKMSGVVEKFFASLYVIALGLPTLALLWFFRTNDTLEQIQKTKENTEVSILFGAQEMLFAPIPIHGDTASPKNAVGFAQLMDLRQQGSHQAIIDLATRKANLTSLDLTGIPLRGVNLQSAKMRYVKLANVDLTGADLRYADLTSADLQHACLERANLKNAKLISTKLQNANLQNADLVQAHLVDAKLSDSDLRGADLSHAKWKKPSGSGNVDHEKHDADFANARYSADTDFPADICPEEWGMKKEK